MLHAARRWTSQMVTAMISADSASSPPPGDGPGPAARQAKRHHGRPAAASCDRQAGATSHEPAVTMIASNDPGLSTAHHMAGADGLPPVLSRADDRWVKTLPAVTTHPVASYFTLIRRTP